MGLDPARCSSHPLPSRPCPVIAHRIVRIWLLEGLVVEDAPSGAKSGLAAGCKVLGVGTGHDGAALRAVSPEHLSRLSLIHLPHAVLILTETSLACPPGQPRLLCRRLDLVRTQPFPRSCALGRLLTLTSFASNSVSAAWKDGKLQITIVESD